MKPVAPVCLFVVALSCITTAQQPATFVASTAKARGVHLYTPKEADVYCAGYISDKAPEKGLFIVTGEEGGLKQIYSDRDLVYLSRGEGFLVNPGGEYILVRKLFDATASKIEAFDGQAKMMKSLGSMWAEVGRIKVLEVHEHVTTAVVTHSCMELAAGDIALPLNAKPTPSAPNESGFDRFAPPSGRNDGVIAAIKEYESIIGAGTISYLNIGAPQGVTVGQIYRIYRTYSSAANDPDRRILEGTPHVALGMRQNYKLTQEQKGVMPREILGEAVVISVTGKSSTVIVTMSSKEIFPGDLVELKLEP